MTKRERDRIARVVRLLNEAATLADELELVLGNGAYVGSLAGGMADELENRLKNEPTH